MAKNMRSKDPSFRELLRKHNWPAGFADVILRSKEQVAYRYLIVDNSRSMLKNDGHRLIEKAGKIVFEECSRWAEVSESITILARHAHVACTPVEIRLLNKAQPVIIGREGESDESMTALRLALSTEPAGLTPVCKQIREVIESVKAMKAELEASNKIALLIIITDGESTDGDVADIIKPLEVLPLEIIIRMCTDEQEVEEYWHNIDAACDLDIRVIDDVEASAADVAENNNFLTYGEVLHRAREFGMMVPAIDALNERLLSRIEIKALLEILLNSAYDDDKSTLTLPNPEEDWGTFVAAVGKAQKSCQNVFCPIQHTPQPWVNLQALAKYQPDQNVFGPYESQLWMVYRMYSFNAGYFSATGTAASQLTMLNSMPVFRSAANKFNSSYLKNDGGKSTTAVLKPMPTFQCATKYEKRLLHQDDLFQLFEDFGLVPKVVKVPHFNQIIDDMKKRRRASIEAGTNKIKISFRDFKNILLIFASDSHPNLEVDAQVSAILGEFDESCHFESVMDADRTEEVGILPLTPAKGTTGKNQTAKPKTMSEISSPNPTQMSTPKSPPSIPGRSNNTPNVDNLVPIVACSKCLDLQAQLLEIGRERDRWHSAYDRAAGQIEEQTAELKKTREAAATMEANMAAEVERAMKRADMDCKTRIAEVERENKALRSQVRAITAEFELAEAAVSVLQTRIRELEASARLPLIKVDATKATTATSSASGQSNDDLLRQCAAERESLRAQAKKDAAEIADLSVCRGKVTSAEQEASMLKLQAAADAQAIASLQGRLAELEKKLLQDKQSVLAGERELAAARAAGNTVAALEEKVVTLARALSQLSEEKEAEIARLQQLLIDSANARSGVLDVPIDVCGSGRCPQVSAGRSTSAAPGNGAGKLEMHVVPGEDPEVAALKERIDAMEALYNGAKAAADQEIAMLQAQAKRDANDLVNANARLAELQAQARQGVNECTGLTKQLDAMAATKSALDRELALLKLKDQKSADKLKRMSALEGELVDLSLAKAGLMKQVATLTAEKEEADRALDALRKQTASDAAELSRLKQRLSELTENTKQFNALMSTKLANEKELTAVQASQEKELSMLRSKITESEKLLRNSYDEMADLTARLNGVSATAKASVESSERLKALEATIARLRTEMADLELAKQRDAKEIDVLLERVKKAESERSELHNALSRAYGESAQLRTANADLAAKEKSDADELIALRFQLQDFATSNEALKAQVQGLKEMAAQNASEINELKTLRSEAETLRKELAATQSHVKELDEMLCKSYDELSDVTGRLNALTDSKAQLYNDGDALKTQIAKDRARIAELEAMVIGSNNDYIASMNKLHEMENRDRLHQDEISSLETQLKTAQAVSNARIAELEGQMQQNQDKSLQSSAIELALLRQRCADLEAQNIQLEASIAVLKTTLEATTAQLDAANDTVTGLRTQCKADEAQLATVRAALKEANATLFARTKELQELQADHDMATAESEKNIAGLREQLDLDENAQLRSQVADLEKLLENSYAEMASVTERLNQLTDAEDKLALLQTQHSDKLAALKKKHDDELAVWKQSQADSDRRLRESEEASTKRLSELVARIAELEAKAKADRDELIEARNARLAGVEDAAALAKTNSELQMALLNTKEKLASLNQDLERARVNATLDASKIIALEEKNSALEEAAKKSSDDVAAFAQRANDLTANHLMALKDVEGYAALRKQHEALSAQLLALEQEHKKYKDATTKELAQKNQELAAVEQLVQNSYNELAELTERLNKVEEEREKKSLLSTLLDEAKAANDALKQEIASLQAENEANNADKLKLQQRIADLEKQLKALADNRDELAKQHLALTVTSAGAQAAAERELSSLAVQGQRDVSEANAMSQQIAELQRQLAESQDAIAVLTQQKAQQDKRMLALVEEYKNYKEATIKQASSLEEREKQALEQLKGVESLKAEVDRLNSLAVDADTKYNTLLNQQADATEKAKQAAQELAQKNKDLASLEQLLQNSYNELAELTERINQSMDGHETTAEQMKQAADDKKALQQANAELKAQLEQSKQTINDLESKHKASTDKLSAANSALNDLAAATAAANGVNQSNADELKALRESMAALAQEYKDYKDATVKQASSLEDREKQALEQLKGVESLKAELASAKAEVDRVKSLAVATDAKCNDTSEKAKQAAQELAQKNKDLASLEQLLQNSYNELAELTERINQSMDGHETTAEQMKQAADDKKALQQANAELKAQLEQSKQTINDLETKQINTSGQALSQQSQVLAAKEVASQATREVDSMKAQAKASAETIAALEAQLKANSDKLSAATSALNDLAAAKASVDGVNQSNADELKALREALTAAKGQLMALALEFKTYKEQTAKEVDGQRGMMDGQAEKDAKAIAQLQATRDDDAQALAALKRQLVDADDRVLNMSRDLQAARDAQAKATADLKSCTETLAAANNALANNRKEIEEQKAAAAEKAANEKTWVASQLEKMTDAETAKIAAEKRLAVIQAQRTSDEKEKEALLKQLKDNKDKMMALANEFQAYKEHAEQTNTEACLNAAKAQNDLTVHLTTCQSDADKANRTIDELKFFLDNTKKGLAGQSSSNEDLLAQLAAMTKERDTVTKERDDGKETLMKLALEFHAYKVGVENGNESNRVGGSSAVPVPVPPVPPGDDNNKGSSSTTTSPARKGWFR